jgi:hypothetical protein
MNNIYIGKVKTIRAKFGEIYAIGLSPADRKLLEQYANEKGYTNLSMLTNREGSKYCIINTYTSTPKEDETPNEINYKDVEPF